MLRFSLATLRRTIHDDNPGGVNGSMQHPLKPAQYVDFSRTSIRTAFASKKGPRISFYAVRTLKDQNLLFKKNF
jgi:hypothetical protein